MILGTVTTSREPVVQVVIRDDAGMDHAIDAVVDTGYTGWLTLPVAVISELGLVWRERGGATLADGSQVLFDVYSAVIQWDGKIRIIPVDCVDAEPLIGMSLIYGYELTV